MENSKMLKEWERKKYAVSMTLDETRRDLAAKDEEARGWAESFNMAEQSIVELQDENERLRQERDQYRCDLRARAEKEAER